MNKVIKDGKVAVLIFPGYGAGWSTLGDSELKERKLFCPELVNEVEAQMGASGVVALAEKLFPGEYLGGVDQLEIQWVPEGTEFVVEEYDGAESLCTKESFKWIKA